MLFSGTVFYADSDGSLQVAPISWDQEAKFRLPVQVWRDMMDAYYPNGAWLHVRRDVFDRLYRLEDAARHPDMGAGAREHPSLRGNGRDGAIVNLDRVEKIAEAVLYEGYMLYPYRPSSVKNQQRWNFGVLCPPSYCEQQRGTERDLMQTEVLVTGDSGAKITIKIRFLQIIRRSIGKLRVPVASLLSIPIPCSIMWSKLEAGSRVYQPWQEAVEREIVCDEFQLADLGIPRSSSDSIFPHTRKPKLCATRPAM